MEPHHDLFFALQLDHILGRYGTFIVERAGSDVDAALDSLRQWRDNIRVIRQTIQNDVSSTKVRLYLRRNMSVRYLIPSSVIDYIDQHGLYLDDTDKGASAWLYKHPDGTPQPSASQAPGSPPP